MLYLVNSDDNILSELAFYGSYKKDLMFTFDYHVDYCFLSVRIDSIACLTTCIASASTLSLFMYDTAGSKFFEKQGKSSICIRTHLLGPEPKG